MLQVLQRVSRWLAAHASLFIVIIAILTFFVPTLFSWVHGTTQTVILGIIMLTMGLTLTTDDFRVLLHRPFDILVGAVAQFFIMPCVAYLLVRVFHLEPALALGILLVGCCPGGVSSNIMSYLCRGDVAFSVGCSSFVAISWQDLWQDFPKNHLAQCKNRLHLNPVKPIKKPRKCDTFEVFS